MVIWLCRVVVASCGCVGGGCLGWRLAGFVTVVVGVVVLLVEVLVVVLGVVSVRFVGCWFFVGVVFWLWCGWCCIGGIGWLCPSR